MSDEPYEVVWSPTARRDLTTLPEKIPTAAIEFLYGSVAENPTRTSAPLRFALEGLRGARRGDYRIIFASDEAAHVVQVVTIAHRSDLYRRR